METLNLDFDCNFVKYIYALVKERSFFYNVCIFYLYK